MIVLVAMSTACHGSLQRHDFTSRYVVTESPIDVGVVDGLPMARERDKCSRGGSAENRSRHTFPGPNESAALRCRQPEGGSRSKRGAQTCRSITFTASTSKAFLSSFFDVRRNRRSCPSYLPVLRSSVERGSRPTRQGWTPCGDLLG